MANTEDTKVEGTQAPAPTPKPVTEQPKAPEVPEEPAQPVVDELSLLKQRATTMGISFSNNIGIDALKEKIKEKLEPKKAEPELTEVEKTNALRASIRNEALKLVRVRIQNLNPNKRDLQGEILTTGNRFIGTVRRYVPYNEAGANGWHVEKVLYDLMKERQFLQLRTVKRDGKEMQEQFWAPEFALEILEPLTEEELKVLANKQAAANGNSV